jgi:hypothetical protein
MKTMKYIFLLALGSSLIMSCGGKKDGSGNENSSGNNASTNAEVKSDSGEKKANLSSTSIDLSTPTKAVESFIQSGQSQNVEQLSQCFSTNCEREFQSILNKEMKEKELQEIKEFTLDSKVLEEKIEGSKAIVKVKFSKRDEKISMELVDGKWKIVGF